MKRLLAIAASAAGALALSSPAHATVTITTTECAGCDNVHLIAEPNPDPQPLVSNGETFTGSGIGVIFTGIEPIHTSADGHGLPWVTALDGTTTFLDIAIQSGYTFTKLGFNLNEFNAPGNPSWMVSVTGYDQFGPTTQAFTLNTNTKFTVTSSNGEVMSHVAIQLLDDNGNPAGENGVPYQPPGGHSDPINLALDGVGQIKIDGVAPVGGIPEPATWALMILGFGGAGAMLRRRRAALA